MYVKTCRARSTVSHMRTAKLQPVMGKHALLEQRAVIQAANAQGHREYAAMMD